MIFTNNPNGGSSVKVYATLDIKTNDSGLAGKIVNITFNTDPLYFIKDATFNDIADSSGYYHTEPVRLQSLGAYSVTCDGITENVTIESFDVLEVELGSVETMVFGKLVPYMTSNNTPEPIVLTGNTTSTNYQWWRVFDGTATPMQSSGKNSWLLIDFGEDVKVSDLKFVPSASYTTRLPMSDVKIYVGDTDTPDTLVREGALPSDYYIEIPEGNQVLGRYCKLEMTTTQSYTQILELNINGYKVRGESYPLIPNMTGATAPYGTVTASYDTGSTYTKLRPFQGFSHNVSSAYGWGAQNGLNQWIQYQFISNVAVKGVSMGLAKTSSSSTLTKAKVEIRDKNDNLINTINLNLNTITNLEFDNVVNTDILKFVIIEVDGGSVELYDIQAYG